MPHFGLVSLKGAAQVCSLLRLQDDSQQVSSLGNGSWFERDCL